MSSQGKGKRLRESERLEIIANLQKSKASSKRSLARDYGVSESAIRKVWSNRDEILERSELMTEEGKQNHLRASNPKFPEVEEIVYQWI